MEFSQSENTDKINTSTLKDLAKHSEESAE